jgi:hypothetical protein
MNITKNANDTGNISADEGNSAPEISCRNDDDKPLLPTSQPSGSCVSELGMAAVSLFILAHLPLKFHTSLISFFHIVFK